MIETHRLLLRPFVTQDAADLLEYRREPLVNCFACMKLNTLEEARAEAEKLAAQPESCLAIVLKDSGKVIGEIEGHPESASPEEDAPADTVSPCWMLHKDYQGKGYAFEAAQAFFDHLFHTPLDISNATKLIICFGIREFAASMPIPKITTCPASTCAKSSACAGKGCFWSLCLL